MLEILEKVTEILITFGLINTGTLPFVTGTSRRQCIGNTSHIDALLCMKMRHRALCIQVS